MARRKVIDGAVQIQAALQAAYSVILEGLKGGAVYIEIGRHEEGRTLEQNKKGWAMWNDISKQLEWYGKKRSPRFWKEFLSSELGDYEIVPNANNTGFFCFGISTSEMNVREFSMLVELTYAFGANHGVKWSEPALACYEEYREANNNEKQNLHIIQ